MVKSSDFEIVKIYNSLYKKAEKSSMNQWCSSKGGKFGSGVKNTKIDPYKCEREGKIGEAAFGFRYKIGEPNWEYIQGGDSADFLINGLKVDVKMSNLIQIENEFGKKLPLRYNIYVIGTILEDDLKNKEAMVELRGWITRKKIKKLVKENYIRKEYGVGNWKNYCIFNDFLKPLGILENYINKHVELKEVVNENINFCQFF